MPHSHSIISLKINCSPTTWMELKRREQNEASLHDLFPFLQLWDLPGKCRDLKQTTHRTMCCGVFCLKQTCMVNSHSLSSEKEDAFITYWLSSKPSVMKPKPLTLRPLSKAPAVFPPRSEAESLHRGPCFSFQFLVWLQSWGGNITSSHLSNLASKTVSTSWRTDGMYFRAATWVEHEINTSDVHIPHLCAAERDTLWHEADQRMTLHPRLFDNHSRLQGLCIPLCTQENSQARRMAYLVNKFLHKYKEPSSGPQHPCERLSSLRTWKPGDARTPMSNLPVNSDFHGDPLF